MKELSDMKKKTIVLILIVLFIFIGLKLLLSKYKILIISSPSTQEDNWLLKIIENFICVLCSLSFTNIISLINLYFSQKNRLEVPSLNIYSRFVSNLRKNNINNSNKQVIIGKGNSFIYIDAVLENDGKVDITSCNINGQNLLLKNLKTKEKLEFNILIYKKDCEMLKNMYELNVLLTDNLNKKYVKKITINLDLKKKEAFFDNKKQKRRYL